MPRWFSLLLCALGATMIGLGLRQAARGRDTRQWTRTPGRILESRVEQVESADEQRRATFRFVIRYEYDARGARRTSDQVWIGSSAVAASDDAARAQSWVERFPAGAEVPVWFDPAEPGLAVLVPGTPRTQVVVLVVAGAALAAAGFVALARHRG
jgi:hypothetical protein